LEIQIKSKGKCEMQLCTMGQIWPGPTLKWPAHGLAFTV
jgi:hypothetical protein